jgi:hypothetical protein
MKTELQYRTFDELMNEVQTDFHVYNTEGMIEPAQLIKIAQKVNYELGLRINKTKEVVLEIDHGKVRLPDDFYVLNYALLCGKYSVYENMTNFSGTLKEDVILNAALCTKCGQPDPTCECIKTYSTDCGTHIQVVQKLKWEKRVYETFERIHFVPSKQVPRHCVSNDPRARHTAEIKNGFVYANIESGSIYISYEGAMEDDEGNLLVLDHPLVNEYYEYAVKQRILENLLMNGEDVSAKMGLIEQRLRPARNNAMSLVNTPNYAELQQVWAMNRKAMNHKYYDMFKSYPY